jgi:hypothetical protein
MFREIPNINQSLLSPRACVRDSNITELNDLQFTLFAVKPANLTFTVFGSIPVSAKRSVYCHQLGICINAASIAREKLRPIRSALELLTETKSSRKP